MQHHVDDKNVVTLEPCHERQVPTAAAVTYTKGVCQYIRQGTAWKAVLPVGPAADGKVPVLCAATLEPESVSVKDVRSGLECAAEGQASGWVLCVPCDASVAIQQRLASMNTHSYIGIYQDPPQDDGSMRLWRPDVLNPRLREQLASPYAAEAARWWDALEDAHEQRDREEGCVAPPRSTSIRNFDAATWRLAALHLQLPLDKEYKVQLGPKQRLPSKPPSKVTPARQRLAGMQARGAAGSIQRGSPVHGEVSASRKRQFSCPMGPEQGPAPNSRQLRALSRGNSPVSGMRELPSTQQRSSAAAAAAAGGGGGRGGCGAAAGACGGGSSTAEGRSAEDEDGILALLASLTSDEGGSGVAGNGDVQRSLSRAQLPPRSPQQPPQLRAASGSATMQRAGASTSAAVAAAGSGREGSKVPSWDGTRPGAAPAAGQGMQLKVVEGAAAHVGGGGGDNSSSQHSDHTPAAPSLGNQQAGAALGAAAAAGGREVLRSLPDGCVAEVRAAGQGAPVAVTHPAPPSAGAEEGRTAAPGAPSAADGTPSCMPPAAFPSPANHGQQQQQQQQQQQPQPQQQQVQEQAQEGVAAEPVAEVEGAAVGDASAGHHACFKAQELVTMGQQVQLHLPSSVPGAMQSCIPFFVDGTLGWGAQAVVLGVAQEVEEDLRPCMPINQSAAASGEEAPCDWDQLCQLTASCSDACVADADRPVQWHAFALKVAQPWRGQVGSKGWEGARREYLKHIGNDLWREFTLLTRAEHPSIVPCYAWGLARLPGYDLPLPALLLENCTGGTLADRLWSSPAPTEAAEEGEQQQAPPKPPVRKPMTFEETQQYIIQVCHAVCYMHSKRIAHRDLKARNVLLQTLADGSEQVRVADLGLAWDFSSSISTNQHAYTPTHRSPEAEEGRWCDAKVDTWGVGALMVELRFAAAPFFFLSAEEQKTGRTPAVLTKEGSPYNKDLTDLEKEVLADCLQPLPQDRPPLKELLKAHPRYFGPYDGP